MVQEKEASVLIQNWAISRGKYEGGRFNIIIELYFRNKHHKALNNIKKIRSYCIYLKGLSSSIIW